MFPRLPFALPLVGAPPTYGVMVAIGFILALLLAWKLSKRHGLSPELVQDVILWAAIAGLLGARVLLVMLEPRAFLANPLAILFEAGVFYGGFVAGAVVGWWRAARLGLDPWAVADVIAPPLALAHAFGRVGCFVAGCCWGKACDLPWAVTFPQLGSSMPGLPTGVPLHPTQLYEVAANLALVVLCVALLRLRAFHGLAWWAYVGLYAAFRFGVEFLRGDPRGSLGPLSTSQVVSLVALAASMVMVVVLARRGRPAPRIEPPAAP